MSTTTDADVLPFPRKAEDSPNGYEAAKDYDARWTEAWSFELAHLRLLAEREIKTVNGGEDARQLAVAGLFRQKRQALRRAHPDIPQGPRMPDALWVSMAGLRML